MSRLNTSKLHRLSNAARPTLITSVFLVAGNGLGAQPARESKAGPVQVTIAHSLLPIPPDFRDAELRDGQSGGHHMRGHHAMPVLVGPR